MKTVFTKIVLKYKNSDQWEIDIGRLYVGDLHKTDAIRASVFPTVDAAKAHSQFTSEPTEVKILNITVEEQDA